ncbi:alpha/beta fold family hydrolase [Hyaloraphidium curvatum]|nr:alpha/beta fold family hydrolase [Hyaloraphidium curvatum]
MPAPNANVKTVKVAHLNATVGYQMPSYDPSKPTLVMANSFTTSSDLYHPQFEDAELSATANLLAVEPFGHGKTRTDVPHFTYWDTAIAALQVLEALGIKKAFVLGTSQGGWIAARMALLAPDVVQGIIPLGTSMDYESERSRQLGCWDGVGFCAPVIEAYSKPVGDDWVVPLDFSEMVVGAGLGADVDPELKKFWIDAYSKNYTGDDGRRRIWVSAINLSSRDGLQLRLGDIRCPVLWMHGTADVVYSVANAQEEIKLFTNSPEAKVIVVEKGQHFLSASHPKEVNKEAVAFIKKWNR